MITYIVLGLISGGSIYSGYKIYKLLKVPREFQHLPSLPLGYFFKTMMFSKNGYDENMKQLQPMLDEHLVIRMFTFEGWSLFTANGALMKQVFNKTDVFSKIDMAKVLRNPHVHDFLGRHNVGSKNGEEWKRHRKVINPIFHQTWNTEKIGDCVNDVIENWESQKDGEIDIRDNIQKMTLDVLGKLIYNIDFHSIKDPNSKLHNLYLNSTLIMEKTPFHLFIPILDELPYFRRTKLINQIKEYNEFIDEMIEIKKSQIENNETESDDLVTALIKSSINSEDSGLSHIEIRDNLKTFILAGHETTSTALTALLYYLAKYTDIQTKIREEILTILDNPSILIIPTTEQLKKMKYLDMAIKEAMRLNTSNGMTIRVAEEDYTLSTGLVIPKGTSLFCHTWAIHHNPKIYNNPDEFIPERFEDLSTEQSRNWQPFLTGSRACMGSTFSLVEQRVTIAMLLQKFEFFMNPSNADFKKLRLTPNIVVRPKDLKLNIKVRF